MLNEVEELEKIIEMSMELGLIDLREYMIMKEIIMLIEDGDP